MKMLTAESFARPTLTVAEDLLGCVIRRGPVSLRIVETEGYLPEDSACHAWRGKTARNAPMWGPPGHAYIYLCYGIHHLLNFVTEPEGRPAAVLIRGAEIIEGEDLVRQRRGGRLDCIGPGKIGQALDLNTGLSGVSLGGELEVFSGRGPSEIKRGARVGIHFASPEDIAAPWRFQAVSWDP
jgi:DNA-3-methyladenine glycosylase